MFAKFTFQMDVNIPFNIYSLNIVMGFIKIFSFIHIKCALTIYILLVLFPNFYFPWNSSSSMHIIVGFYMSHISYIFSSYVLSNFSFSLSMCSNSFPWSSGPDMLSFTKLVLLVRLPLNLLDKLNFKFFVKPLKIS